jgi:peptide/nickel transport system substrate-binding protein
MRAALLIGLAVVVIAAGVLGSLSLLTHFGVIGAHSSSSELTPVHGGTWTDDFTTGDPDSFIPNAEQDQFATQVDQALYLPLFYGDAQGLVHPGAASEVPTVQNGGIRADATTWTFHLRPGLVWSDGAPYDARDVDYTWRLWADPKFAATYPQGVNQIASAEVSADDLSITFHLKGAYAPFLSYWVDGGLAPLPAHHFSRIASQAIYKSPDNLNPQVTSGPFMMAERVPGDHYTLVRNPRYYLAKQGLPYLDKVVFRIPATVGTDPIVKDLQAGAIDSAWFLPPEGRQTYQRLTNYRLTTSPSSVDFEALYFNFHNTVLASHLEVRQAMAMAVDQQTLITQAWHGFATPLCTDHGSALHPGYDPRPPCPGFDLALANQLLSDHGWVKGADGVRTRGGQRLEFEYSTTSGNPWRSADEAILQRDFLAIGIKLDIQNYPHATFFGPFLFGGTPPSPPTGAVTGRFDIAEFEQNPPGYDPDDSLFFACDQVPSAANSFNGGNVGSYCNPALDKLFAQELATGDAGVRQQLFEQIHQIYLTDFPFITLYSQLDLAIVRKGTHNYQPSPIAGGTVNIWQWWCDHGKC